MPEEPNMQNDPMDPGTRNPNGQELIRKTDKPSTTHYNQKIWVMRCAQCRHTYGSNGCDAHLRRCPKCKPAGKPGEPID